MASAYRQFRGRCLQKMIIGLAILLAGIAVASSDVVLGALTIPRTPWAGSVLAVVGVLYAAAAVLALRRRPRPAVLDRRP